MNQTLSKTHLAAALALVLTLAACGRSESRKDASASRATSDDTARARSGDRPNIAPTVVVEAPMDSTVEDDNAFATSEDEGEPSSGSEAARRYMAARDGVAPPVAPRADPPQRTVDQTADSEADAPPTTRVAPAPPTRRVAAAPTPAPSTAAREPAVRVAVAPRPAPPASPSPASEVRAPVRIDGDARTLNQRAIGLINAGRPEQAIPLLERAIAAQPRDAEMLGNLGYAYILVGENERARARLRAALDLSPTRSATWLNLGQTYAELGQRDVAVDAVLKGYRYSTRKDSVRNALARAASGQRFSPAWREAAGIALDRIGADVASRD
ncbi:tetratricopeptide repeat protein [Lysobacter xanthus]